MRRSPGHVFYDRFRGADRRRLRRFRRNDLQAVYAAKSVWKTRIAEPQRTAFFRWRGDTQARNAVYANRNPAALVGWQAEHAATGGDRRTIVRSQPGARRHAANLVARPRERPQALPDPRRRPQP